MEIVVFAAEITLSDISSVNVLHMGPVLSAIVIRCSYIKLLLVIFSKFVYYLLLKIKNIILK